MQKSRTQIKLWIFIFLMPTIALGQIVKVEQKVWVDSIFNTLTPDQKLGQLFMVAAYSNKNESHYQKIDSLVEIYKIGGLIFFQGGPIRQALLTNRYQSKANVPLMIGMDAEWGLGMRLMDSTISFPRQMTLGASQNPTLAYKMGAEIANHCKRLGVHVNFAPSVDVNNNPNNPVIGIRSFGEEKEKVASFGLAYMNGLQENGVMACAKHFPGHGDTDADSHHSLPVINHNKQRLDELELYPFKKLIKNNVMSMMVAHIHMPAYDNRPNVATTLSPKVVNGLLKKKLQFKGLVFTDALNMKGVSKFYAPGEVEYQALLAGNDILLFAEDVPTALQKIKNAFKEGKLDSTEIYERVKRILEAKYWAGLNHFVPIDTTGIYFDLNTNQSKAIRNELYEKSITLLKNDNKILPFKNLDQNTFASVAIGLKKNTEYQSMLDNYAPFSHFVIEKSASTKDFNLMLDSLASFSNVIVSLHDLNNRKKENYGISEQAIDFIKKLQSKTKVTISYFGNLYGLKNFEFTDVLVCAFEDNEATRTIVPQMLFGAMEMKGKLPVRISPVFGLNSGITLNIPSKRLSYGYPENINLQSANFSSLDSILNEAIKDGSTPGIQVQIVKSGKVVFRKNYGYHSYDKILPVTDKTIYDLASITKVAATMPVIMFLYDWQKLNVNGKLVEFLPELKGTNKESIILKDLLVHQAGLISYADFWRKTLTKGAPSDFYLSNQLSTTFSNRVSNQWFSKPSLADSVLKWTIKTNLSQEKADTGCYAYKYSDLTFSFLKRIAEKQIAQSLPNFLDQNFYKPLGLSTLGFLPLQRFSLNQLPPTEEDKTFRLEKIQGTVHDQNASLTNGIAGHAGLFGCANDLAILGQMLLQKGAYGGAKYLKPETIEFFTKQHFTNNRRALGWDRPFPPDEISLATEQAFGHTGFTGTAWWIDPKEELVFVLLANRTYPFADNKRFTDKSVRTKALNAAYNAIRNFSQSK